MVGNIVHPLDNEDFVCYNEHMDIMISPRHIVPWGDRLRWKRLTHQYGRIGGVND